MNSQWKVRAETVAAIFATIMAIGALAKAFGVKTPAETAMQVSNHETRITVIESEIKRIPDMDTKLDELEVGVAELTGHSIRRKK